MFQCFFLFSKKKVYNVKHTASILTYPATNTKIPTTTEIKIQNTMIKKTKTMQKQRNTTKQDLNSNYNEKVLIFI
jgi:DNA uptake protein ComE-like DNA-binding protein